MFSADADFSPVLRRLRRHDWRTVVFAAGAMSEAYKAPADVVIDIPTFIREGLQWVEAEEVAEASAEVDAAQMVLGEWRQQAAPAVRRFVLDATGPVPLPSLCPRVPKAGSLFIAGHGLASGATATCRRLEWRSHAGGLASALALGAAAADRIGGWLDLRAV